MKAAIENKITNISIELIKSSGGVFEIVFNDRLIYSKKQTGRFPEESQIIGLLES
ncbi:MAG: SelT/SelW/SelH family protein [Calditrichaeota bacterium]|nr:MAG: SelT/SelW/SelH family protein [Calditrichota bacterium]